MKFYHLAKILIKMFHSDTSLGELSSVKGNQKKQISFPELSLRWFPVFIQLFVIKRVFIEEDNGSGR